MKYYKCTVNTPCCGTSNEHYLKFENPLTEKEQYEIGAMLCQENAEKYEYLVFGWSADPVGEGEMTEEEYEEEMAMYYEDCSYDWEEITEEEYREEMNERGIKIND